MRLLWDGVCPLPAYEPPSPPAPPFNGGQCSVLYGAYLDVEEVNNNVFPPVTTVLRSETGGYYKVTDIGVTSDATRKYVYIDTPNYGSPSGGPARRRVVETSLNNTLRIVSIELRRVDGQPDNCGDPPSTYPGSGIVPPGGFTSAPTTVTYNDGTDVDLTFNLVPPVLPSPGALLPPVTVNVKGPFVDLALCFSLTGEVAICTGDGGSGLDDEFKDFKEDWDRFKEDWDFNNNPPNFDIDPGVNKEDKEPGKEGEEDGIEGLLGVLLTLTKPSSDAQFGTPTVYFAGWLTFKLQGGQVERVPISFENGYFPAPPGATGYAYTLTKGAEGAIRVYSKVEV